MDGVVNDGMILLGVGSLFCLHHNNIHGVGLASIKYLCLPPSHQRRSSQEDVQVSHLTALRWNQNQKPNEVFFAPIHHPSLLPLERVDEDRVQLSHRCARRAMGKIGRAAVALVAA